MAVVLALQSQQFSLPSIHTLAQTHPMVRVLCLHTHTHTHARAWLLPAHPCDQTPVDCSTPCNHGSETYRELRQQAARALPCPWLESKKERDTPTITPSNSCHPTAPGLPSTLAPTLPHQDHIKGHRAGFTDRGGWGRSSRLCRLGYHFSMYLVCMYCMLREGPVTWQDSHTFSKFIKLSRNYPDPQTRPCLLWLVASVSHHCFF